MVARRDLNPGDIILREKPMVTGPNLDNAASGGSLSQAVCLGCYAPLNQNTFHPCSKCKAPLCNSSCEEHPAHVDECTVLKQNPIGFYSSYSHGTLMSPSKNTFSKVSDKVWSWSDKHALVSWVVMMIYASFKVFVVSRKHDLEISNLMKKLIKLYNSLSAIT